MSIEVALFRKGDLTEEVTPDEVEGREDYDVVKKNLYCAYDECAARIEFVPRGKRREHFKTWPNEDHSEECEDFFEREQKNKSRKNLATNTRGLSDKHIDNVLRGLINSVAETEEERDERLKRQRSRRKKSNTKGTDGEIENITSVNPSTDASASLTQEGERAPTVRKRHSVSALSEDDIGSATALYEEISSIEAYEKRAIFLLEKGNTSTKIYFEENFFANSPNNVERMFKVLKELLQEGFNLVFYGIGNVERRNNEVCLVVNSYRHLRVNKKSIGKFILDTTKRDMFNK
ncbi:hypothetical protein CEH05_19985 [Halobacillus halophilus]|uniref:Uncharacterized protein n=1 Tax=Halobacillus halophilus (strain ATCC 35676 / DSM 2266 / JCM 20832 / KCTC 3685 / LMG 17431 / NBRC 102448 / NCIMB 2269) TaxID=866895 RepID=I0JTD8_HALH3|nr:hypothetical protein [Halobacillus halophilus]ASF41321.1 hypothetical protein CEH05_19985 [Halobacillus halophilus]CCG47410.1 hypothetical protein HBHAL_5075 [Halobacillus halophilus DSM 2266]